MKKTANQAILILCSVFLHGCLSVSLDPKSLDSIQSISVDQEVKVSDSVTYSTSANRMVGVVAGPIVGVGVLLASPGPAQIKAYLEKENINIREIVRTEFVSALQKDPRFNKKLSESGQAHFVLEIIRYGLINKPNSSELQPLVHIRATLLNSRGEVLWKNHDWTNRNNEIPALPYEAYFETPDIFRSSFKSASADVVQMILSK